MACFRGPTERQEENKTESEPRHIPLTFRPLKRREDEKLEPLLMHPNHPLFRQRLRTWEEAVEAAKEYLMQGVRFEDIVVEVRASYTLRAGGGLQHEFSAHFSLNEEKIVE